MSIQQKAKGFTIIEVVLVLAIAGLIFMMVFIALPALQRSQRDTQRKGDLSRVMTAITNYSSSNRGNIPTGADVNGSFKDSYLLVNSDSFIDPSGAGSGNKDATSYDFQTSNSDGDLNDKFSTETQNIIYYTTGAVCNIEGNYKALTPAGNRKVTVRMYLEGGGVDCRNN